MPTRNDRLDKRLKAMAERLARDWKVEEGFPEDAERFDSLFTNFYGERWWCRVEAPPADESAPKRGLFLVVWGDDVEARATTLRGRAETVPWLMSEQENFWLSANLQRLAELSEVFERYGHEMFRKKASHGGGSEGS